MVFEDYGPTSHSRDGRSRSATAANATSSGYYDFYSTLTIVIRRNIGSLYLLYTHRYLAVATSAAELPKLNYGLGAVFNAVDIAIY